MVKMSKDSAINAKQDMKRERKLLDLCGLIILDEEIRISISGSGMTPLLQTKR
jgi:hypothetical protein